jgi:zinc transport system substrate-binding protein
MFHIALLAAVITTGAVIAYRLRPDAGIDRAFVSNESGARFSVVASFYPLGFLAEQIAGDRASVIIVTPPGTEPHEYEPTAQSIAAMHDSDILLLNGAGLEPWGDDIRAALAGAQTRVVVFGDTLAEGDDPHIWLDPVRAQAMAVRIMEELVRIDPDGEAVYRMKSDRLLASLALLDDAYRTGLSQCERRAFVTSHQSFGYLAGRYGLEQIAIAGFSPDAEPSPKQLISLAKLVKTNDVRVIFFEELASPKLAETLARETGATTAPLNPLEGLTDGDMAAGKSYLTEMHANLNALRAALSCP